MLKKFKDFKNHKGFKITKDLTNRVAKAVMTFCICFFSLVFACPVLLGLWLLFTEGALLSAFLVVAIIKLIVLPLLCLIAAFFTIALLAFLFTA